MPVYSAKSDTQYAVPGPLPVPGPKLLRKLLHPAAFWRPGDFLLPGTMAIMLSMESMIAISSRRGGGGRQTFPVPLSRNFFRYLSFLSCSLPPGRAAKSAARGEETGDVRYRVLRIATGAVRPRNDIFLHGVRFSGPMCGHRPLRREAFYVFWKAGRERSAVLPRPGGLKWLSCFL